MARKISAAAAALLCAPTAVAAIDDAGMEYTSAAEGFYGYIRVPLTLEEDRDANLGDEASYGTPPISRLGVRGSADLGDDLKATYRYEWGIHPPGGGFARVRLRQAGLRGSFGEVILGQQWSLDYQYVFNRNDIANWGDGSVGGYRRLRMPSSARYNSKTLNGFKFSAQAQLLGEDDGNDIDRYLGGVSWTKAGFYCAVTFLSEADCDLSAKCLETIRGAASAAAGREISRQADALGMDAAAVAAAARSDAVRAQARKTIGAVVAYRGDDWKVSYTAKKADIDGVVSVAVSDGADGAPGGGDDTIAARFDQSGEETAHAFAAQYAVGKLTWRGVYETTEQDTGLGKYGRDVFVGEVQYDLGRKVRGWLGYRLEDNDIIGEFGSVNLGYRVDF